jgi:hypothetical protein
MPDTLAGYPDQIHSSHVSGGKRTAAAICAILLGIILLVSGGWKVLSPLRTGELLEQAQVPAGWGTLGAATLGTFEVLAAFLLFVPRFRKVGGLLGSALLVFFIGWIAVYYHVLVGQECNCFPLIKRTVGPGFFVSDAVMLLLGVIAFLWAPAVRSLRGPLLALLSIAVLSAISLGASKLENRGLAAPSPLIVDGKPESVTNGKVFLFFYDPQCMHCDAAARFMAKFNWGSTRVIAIPTTEPQFAPSFIHDTGLKAGTCLETAKLRQVFKFVDPPYGVTLVNGHQTATFGEAQFNVPLPKADLQKLGFVQ